MEESGETVCRDSNRVTVWLCPLCQQGLPDRGSLALHLNDGHSVLPNCVDKLLDIAAPKQGASGVDGDTDVKHDADAASLQLKLLEASASLSDPCQINENTEGPQHYHSRHTLIGSGDKDKEMDKEVEGVRDPEGGGVVLGSDQERDQSTETPDDNEKSTGKNGVLADGDDSRPFKCNACLEAFPTRTALCVHYNSASHVQQMRTGSLKQGGENDTPAPSVPFLSRPYLSNKPYQCAVCRVSYNHAITLESHLKSVLHQTRSRNAGISANSATGNSGSNNMATNLVVTSGGSTAQLVSPTSSNCVTPASLTAAAMTTKDGEPIQTQPAPSLLSSPVASAQAVSAFLTLLTSSPSSLSHSLLPSLFAAGASPATPQLIPQHQMLMPFIVNGLQTQSQSLNPELLTQSVPLLGLNAAQQAILAQRLSSLQNQWPTVSLQATTQTCSEDNQTNKSKLKEETNETTIEEKVSLKAGKGKHWPLECDDGEREICEEEDSKGYAQELISALVSKNNRVESCRIDGDNEMNDGTTDEGNSADGKGGDIDKCIDRSPSVTSNSSMSPTTLNLMLSPDCTPQKSQVGTSPCASVLSPKLSPFKRALNSPDPTRPHANWRARHFSQGPPILSEFQIQVLHAFLESRSGTDAASPPHDDCESLGREVGLTEAEVHKWLTDAQSAKERQKGGGAGYMRSIAAYNKRYKRLDNEEDGGALTIDGPEGGDSGGASGSHAMDLSNSGRRRNELGRESQGDSCLASDSGNEEFYTSVIVSEEDSLSGSMREGPGSPAKEEALIELAEDKGSGGGKVLRSTTVFLSDAEDDYDDEEAAAQRAKRRKRKRELEREEVEVKKERLDPDVDLELEAQADPPSQLSIAIDQRGLPSGILHSLPLSLSLAPFSTQFLSPYVLSLPPSVVGLGVAEGDGGKLPAFPNPPNITRFSDPLITSHLSLHTHTSHYMSNGGDCEAALDLSIRKRHSSTSASSTSLMGDKTSAQKGRLLDGLGLRPTAFGLPEEGRLGVVKVKPEQATSNSSGFASGNNMAKASTVYMRAAERLNTSIIEREKEREREREKEERDQKGRPKARRYRDMRRSRTIIQAEQLDVLYGCYFKDPNPGKHEFEQISEWVHLPKKVVQIWFQNMRARERKGEVRFVSDGTLAAVGKPLIKFTWPLSQPIFSSTPKSNTNSSVSTGANPVQALPKMEVKKEEIVKIKNQVPNRPKEVASSVSSMSSSVSAVPKTKMEMTNNVTMVKIAPKCIAQSLPVVPKETRPTPPRPPPKHAPEEEVGENDSDEEVDDHNQEKPLAGPGSTNRMVPKMPSTPISKSLAATSQKKNGLNYWSAKGPFKINTLSREQLGLSTPRTPTVVGATAATAALSISAAASAAASTAATTTTTTASASPQTTVSIVTIAKTAPSESSFLHHSTTRRPRTHLSCLQLSILQSCYETCAHPNALECEAIGTELGLPLKVVQIWFQNTRAKEKRWRLQQEKLSPMSSDPSKKVDMSSGSYLQYNALRAHRPILPKPVQLTVLEPSSPPARGQPAGRETLRGRCEACNAGFESRAAARSHVFSPRHLATLRTTNFGQPATIINNGSDTGSSSVSALGSVVEDPPASPTPPPASSIS
ncbi:zinc finger homeobox protein 4 isoform X2 [Coregonus clupeaformis]|uniref:zinc finger homeobox protein 4 isoform X2 n=1 Tax=Coregonus clupeaformis TaxID=59861 RepID=UPI001BDF7D0A|nr:zinc finger homeobox protein 4 isoform X2 [Coregonus clupeaformis]